MSNWRSVKEIVSYFGKGVTPKYVNNSSIIVINQKCIRNNRIDYSFAQFIDDNREYSKDKYLKVGDILVNSTGQGTAGRVAMVELIPEGKRLVVDSHVLVLRTKNYYESKCLNYSLFSIEKILQTYIDGSTGQGEFDRVRLFNILVKYPHQSLYQCQIASVLSALDDKIELNNKINAELEQMAKTLYDYWFVQFDFPDAEGKPYKSSGGKMVYNEVLKREIPEGWEVGNLLGIADLQGGGTPNTSNQAFWNGDIPFFTPSDAGNSVFSIQTIQNITKSGLEKSSTKLFEKGTIFLTARGSVGRVMIASKKMAMNQSCYALKPKDKNYIFLYFSTLGAVGYLRAKSSGSIFNAIVSNDIKFTPVVIPADEIRNRFNELMFPLFERILINLQQNQQLSTLRDWLLPMLMNGQVSVTATGDTPFEATKHNDLNDYQSGDSALVAAEPKASYGEIVQLNIPDNKKGFARQVLAGKIVSVFKDDTNFTNIKFQKIQFLAEHIIEADIHLNYYYQAAGPYDNAFMKAIYGHFRNQKWFTTQDKRFIPLENHKKIEGYYQGYFGAAQDRLSELFRLLYQKTEAESEIIATLYAVWNNRIIESRPSTDEDLFNDFYQWSNRKLDYTEEQLSLGLQWLRDNRMEPRGFGKLIKKAK